MKLQLLALVLFAPMMTLAQSTQPTANAPAGASTLPAPGPAADNVSGPGKQLQAARKAINDRMHECMKNATTRDQKKACRDEMRAARKTIREEKPNQAAPGSQ